MSSYIFDTHSHYDDKAFDSDRDEILGGLLAKGIGKVVDVGADMPSSKMALELAKQYEFVYAALGVHPSEVEGLTEDDMAWISSHAAHEKVAAIGEIGLDYHWPEPEPALQKQWFRRQIELAKEVKLPIIVHSRDAAEPTMQIIQETKAYECGGVIHCYSYSPEMAEEYVKMGFFIGMGGVLTFKNAKKLKEAAAELPIERILLETDCPYLAPEPYRGKRNSSLYLPQVVAALAEIKGLTCQEIEDITWHNGCRFYGLE